MVWRRRRSPGPHAELALSARGHILAAWAFAIAIAPAGCALYRDDDPAPDAGVIDAESPPPDAHICDLCCNPLLPRGQQGCPTGLKCSWLLVGDGSDGQTSCVRDGDVALGGACTWGPPGPSTGFDDCATGGVCIAGTCEDLCGFDNAPTSGCPEGATCVGHDGMFDDYNAAHTLYAGTCAL